MSISQRLRDFLLREKKTIVALSVGLVPALMLFVTAERDRAQDRSNDPNPQLYWQYYLLEDPGALTASSTSANPCLPKVLESHAISRNPGPWSEPSVTNDRLVVYVGITNVGDQPAADVVIEWQVSSDENTSGPFPPTFEDPEGVEAEKEQLANILPGSGVLLPMTVVAPTENHEIVSDVRIPAAVSYEDAAGSYSDQLVFTPPADSFAVALGCDANQGVGG